MICLFSSIKLIMSRDWRFHGNCTISEVHSTMPFVTNLSFPRRWRWCRSPCPRHVDPGHLSSPGLYRPGSGSDHGHVDHSLDRGGHLFSESSPHGHLGELVMENDRHGAGTAPADHLDHGHVRSRTAKMQRGGYVPTVRRLSAISTTSDMEDVPRSSAYRLFRSACCASRDRRHRRRGDSHIPRRQTY